jgi:hypothetical protein
LFAKLNPLFAKFKAFALGTQISFFQFHSLT